MPNFLKKHKKIILATLCAIIVGAGVFGFFGSRANIKIARAQEASNEKINLINWVKDPGNATLWLIGTVVSLAVAFLGWVLGVLLQVLFWVARYNNFINSPAIVTGWVVLRDLCNIFFIVIFLVMVVSTVLDIEEYSYSRILKKLIIMAVLINFSKVICGVFIDAAQVVMMAFMSSIGQLGAKYFTYMLGLDQIMAKASNMRGLTAALPENWSSILMSYVLALIYMIITIATVLVLLVVLVQRVVMLWIYVVLSPAAYFLSTFPAGASYSGKWWSEFVKYVTIGPIIAFFLWLSFVSMGNTDNQNQILKEMSKDTTAGGQQTTATQSVGPQIGITEGGSPSHVVKFIIGIALLLGGLMAAQSIGGMAGNFAGSTIKKLQTAGTGTLKGMGKMAAYLPKEYGKKVGYDMADKTLGAMGKWGVVGGFAIKKRGELTTKRESDEEKELRYLKFVEEPELDKIIQNYSGEGRTRLGKFGSKLARGQEASGHAYKNALVEKMKRGDEWGMDLKEKRNNKTRALIELAKLAGHSVTSSGEDAFKDAEAGKLFHDFRKANVGMIDDEEMRRYFLGGNGRNAAGRDYNYEGLKGADNSEYYRGNYDINGNLLQRGTAAYLNNRGYNRDQNGRITQESPNSMLVYTASRLKSGPFTDLHHENFARDPATAIIDPATGQIDPRTATSPVLDAMFDARGGRKKIAKVRDDGTAQQGGEVYEQILARLRKERIDATLPQPQLPNHNFLDSYNRFIAAQGHQSAIGIPLQRNATDEEFVGALMRPRGLTSMGGQFGPIDPIGNSRNVTGSSKSAEIKSGITGLDKIEKGRLAMNFSELGLKNIDGMEFEGKGKAEIAKKIRESLSSIDENLARSVEEKINGLSSLILHNKEKDMTGVERMATHAHELLHARMSSAVSDDELRGVWNDSIDEEERGKAREKVKKVYGNDKMSEDAIMKEYFTEGLTNKTRWAVKDPEKKITLGKNAEQGLDTLLKSKGSNIEAFKSNITETRPNKGNIKQVMAGAVDGKSQDSMKNLAAAIENLGDGLDAINKVGGSFEDLSKAVLKNNTLLEKNAGEYKRNSDRLNNLSRAEKFNQWRQSEKNLNALNRLSRKL